MQQPDIVAVIRSCFRDAWPLMASRMNVYWILALVCALLYVATFNLARTGDAQFQENLRLQEALQPANLCAAIAAFFVIAAAVRTVRPEFRMTAATVLAIIGLAIAVGICTELGFFLFIVPGLWWGVKLSQTVWAYLLSDGENPFQESWQITTGHFWETLGFFILMSILVSLVLLVVFAVPATIAFFVPLSGIVLAPLAFLGYTYVYHISILANMRWMLELRALRNSSVAVPAPAAT
jgi:uncharacterized membrane protein